MSCATTLISRLLMTSSTLFVKQAGGEVAVAGFFQVADDGFFEPQCAASMTSRAIAVVEQKFCDALPDVT